MLKICLDRNPKSRLLPEDILKSFFYNCKLEELIQYLDDDQERVKIFWISIKNIGFLFIVVETDKT